MYITHKSDYTDLIFFFSFVLQDNLFQLKMINKIRSVGSLLILISPLFPFSILFQNQLENKLVLLVRLI